MVKMMASERKKWPHHCAWARDDSATNQQRIINEAKRLLSHPDLEVSARAGRILHYAHESKAKLVSVGAKVAINE